MSEVDTSGFWGDPLALTPRGEITVRPADDPKKIRLGWTMSEEIGIVIINDYAVHNLEIPNPCGEVEKVVIPMPILPPPMKLDNNERWEYLDI